MPFHQQIVQKSQVVHQLVMKVNMNQMNLVTTVMCQVTLISQNLCMQHLLLMLDNSFARSFCSQLGGGFVVLFLISFAIVPEVSITLVMH